MNILNIRKKDWLPTYVPLESKINYACSPNNTICALHPDNKGALEAFLVAVS